MEREGEWLAVAGRMATALERAATGLLQLAEAARITTGQLVVLNETLRERAQP